MELFRPDKPIDSESDDRFQRYDFAKRLASIVSTGKFSSSLVVGIYGKWGEGKTSVLKFIEREIGDNAIVVNFNPWLFSDEKQLIDFFFKTLATTLGKSLTSGGEKLAKKISDYADAFGTAASAIHAGGGAVASAAKKVSESFMKQSIEDLKKKVDNLIINSGKNFVIFIDDIDRLDISEIQSVFKLVKLLGDFPRTAYVLSFDDEMVASALGPKYPRGNKDAGHEFLDKIIQLPIHLPKASKEMLTEYTFGLLNSVLDYFKVDISEEEGRAFVNKFNLAFLPVLSNPRSGVRFANSIGFSIPLLLGQANMGDLVIIEGIKIFYPDLYFFVRTHPEYFIRGFSNLENVYVNIGPAEKQRIKDSIDGQLDKYIEQKENLRSMLSELFPQLQTLYRNVTHSNATFQKWYREMRICSWQYFDRYFSYVPQKDDISDISFKDFLSGLSSQSLEQLTERFTSELPKWRPQDVVFKISNFLVTFSEIEAPVLAALLAKFGEYFPIVNRILDFSGRDRVADMIKNLLEKVPTGGRGGKCVQVLENANPFSFCTEIAVRLKTKQRDVGEQPFLNDNELLEVLKTVIRRFENEYKQTDFTEALPDHTIWTVLVFYEDLSEIGQAQALLTKFLGESPENSLKIIKIFTPTLVSSSKNESFKGAFKDETYFEMSKYIDTGTLYDATIHSFGKRQFKREKGELEEELSDSNLIALFQSHHEDNMNSKYED